MWLLPWLLLVYVYPRGAPAVFTAGESPLAMAVASQRVHRLVPGLIARRQARNQGRREVCYDEVGCFPQPRKSFPLRTSPEFPDRIQTRFWLYTRSNASHPEGLWFEDGEGRLSVGKSRFSPGRPVRMLVHGYRGSGDMEGARKAAVAFLTRGDDNVVVVDWERGAGPPYRLAVANTEVVGRQMSLLVMAMLSLGSEPREIHIIGFSLGAHVAACASHMLRARGVKIGRITGLDPASPMYKNQRTLPEARKLDPEDAVLVDVVHTDGSLVWVHGFGLRRPLGHVDFFPNGGEEQPGCRDGRASLVASTLEGTVNSSVVCSHVRAWLLFLESLGADNGNDGSVVRCRFTAYPCRMGILGKERGACLPPLDTCGGNTGTLCGEMGVHAPLAPGRGTMYLVTRDTWPYCGQQLKAIILMSHRAHWVRGHLHMWLDHGASSTHFRLQLSAPDSNGEVLLWGFAAAPHGSLGRESTPNVQAFLTWESRNAHTSSEEEEEEDTMEAPHLTIKRVTIEDLHGNRWYFCGKTAGDSQSSHVTITLTLTPC